MKRSYLYLKLRFAGLSTIQIYNLCKLFPHFLTAPFNDQHQLLSRFLSMSKITHSATISQKFQTETITQILTTLNNSQTHFVSIDQCHYPSILREIYQPPLILFYRGRTDLLSLPHTLAVIGSRHATQYSYQALDMLFQSLQARRFCIVSGLAKGADCYAHQCAMYWQMPTIAVLGFGHNHHYPKETAQVRQYIEQNGIVISEYLPDDPPKKYYFPQRNRIISGISKGVLITESMERSGTLITTQFALEQNRNVYILPGSIFDPMVKGNLLSAQEGAKIVINAMDIIEDYI